MCIGGQMCGYLYEGSAWTEPGEVTAENPGGRVLSIGSEYLRWNTQKTKTKPFGSIFL